MDSNETPPWTSVPYKKKNSSNDSQYQGPENTRGHGKGRELAWHEKYALKFKRDNLNSIWHKGLSLVSLRPSDSVMDPATAKQKLVLGAIITTSHHTEFNDLRTFNKKDPIPTFPWDEPYVTATPFGVVHSKHRKFIVIWSHHRYMTCLPVYTHNHKGMRENEREHNVSIRDSRSDLTQLRGPDEVHDCLVAEMTTMQYIENNKPKTREFIMDPQATVEVTHFVTIWKNVRLTYEGRIVAHDAQRLKGLVLSAMT